MNLSNATSTVVLAIATAAAALPALAQQPAVTAPHRVNVRAGPDNAYPVVAVLGPRMGVTVFGCLEGYSWCDIGFGPQRGWVHAANLRYYYEQRYVPLAGVAPIVGIGLTAFMFDDYWGHHYRGRPWYSERDRWHGERQPFAGNRIESPRRYSQPGVPMAPVAPVHPHPHAAMQAPPAARVAAPHDEPRAMARPQRAEHPERANRGGGGGGERGHHDGEQREHGGRGDHQR